MYSLYCLLFVIGFLCSLQTISADEDDEDYGNKLGIWNGVNALIEEWPYMASIRMGPTRYHLGGAVVLNEDTILTAAHCIPPGQPLNSRVVVLGQTLLMPIQEENVYLIRQFIQHPNYLKNMSEYDIGLIKLSRRIDFTETKGRIEKVALPNGEPDGPKCVATGWGGTAPGTDSKGVLQKVDIPIQPCVGDHPRVICAGYYNKPAGICYGDSGGPLLCPTKANPKQYSVYGLTAILWSKCGERPAGFSKVSEYLNWIKENS